MYVRVMSVKMYERLSIYIYMCESVCTGVRVCEYRVSGCKSVDSSKQHRISLKVS